MACQNLLPLKVASTGKQVLSGCAECDDYGSQQSRFCKWECRTIEPPHSDNAQVLITYRCTAGGNTEMMPCVLSTFCRSLSPDPHSIPASGTAHNPCWGLGLGMRTSRMHLIICRLCYPLFLILFPNTPNQTLDLGIRSFSLSMTRSDITDDCDEVVNLQECPAAEPDCTAGSLGHIVCHNYLHFILDAYYYAGIILL